ncbi:MAG: isocitrate/isopropylmalate family dehydrogenase [Dehalococcoidia bacterium]|nr:isocitrate/isopropylmalate family dehydrogenase [Dehalococcoidia bacterium]
MKCSIAVLPGDGVGIEIVPQALKVLEAVGKVFGHEFVFRHGLIGRAAEAKLGHPLPEESIKIIRETDAILHGAIGGPVREYAEGAAKVMVSPIRRTLHDLFGLSVTIRPAKVFPSMVNASVVKPQVVQGTDIVVVRDFRMVTNNVTPGEEGSAGRRIFWDKVTSHEEQITELFKLAAAIARGRRSRISLMTQPQIYANQRLWASVATEMARGFPDISLDVVAPDNLAMQLVRNPRQFDVILTSEISSGGMINNLAATLLGSVGMAASAFLPIDRAAADSGDVRKMVRGKAFYEPIHGSAPLHAGKWEVNPVGTIMAAAMMLEYSFGLVKEAQAVEMACNKALEHYRTYDVMEEGKVKVGTAEMGDRVAEAVTK